MNRISTTLTLEYLFRSKTRADLIWHLLKHYNQAFGLRELGRIIGKHPNAVLRELHFFRNANLVIVNKTPTKHLYQINMAHPFFYEILALFHKSYGLGGLILHNAPIFTNTEYVILTYFYIFSIPKDKYDIDLLIVGSPDFEKITNTINSFEAKLNTTIRYSIISSQEFLKRKQSKDPFVLNIMENPFVLLLGDFKTVLKTNSSPSPIKLNKTK